MNEKQMERGIGMVFTDEDWLHCLYLGSIKTRFEICEDENGDFGCIRSIQGHSGGMIISTRLMNYVMIPYNWKRFIHHVGLSCRVCQGLDPGPAAHPETRSGPLDHRLELPACDAKERPPPGSDHQQQQSLEQQQSPDQEEEQLVQEQLPIQVCVFD